MSLYEILKAAKIGTAPDVYTKLRAQIAPFAKGGSTLTEKELEGVPPLSFTSNGSPLIACTVYGDMEQEGTPTPSSPIQPSECGDLETTGEHAEQYKIPISSGGTTTPVYLGEVQSTRQIKKLVITGQETWSKSSTYQGSFYSRIIENPFGGVGANSYSACCSHAKKVNKIDANTFIYGSFAFDGGSSPYNVNLFIGEAAWTKDDFKAWLAQQYANGTPVTVWYILATPQTTTLNEPLRKIGTYADSVSVSNIPTVDGSNTIDIDTTLSPSKLYIKYYE